jgi:hypothetical protein
VKEVFFKNSFVLLTAAVLVVSGFLIATPVSSNTLAGADTTTAEGAYTLGSNIDITVVTYNKPITVIYSPQTQLKTMLRKYTINNNRSGTANIIFRQAIQTKDTAADSGAVIAAIDLNGVL